MRICLDASMIVAWLVTGEHSDRARQALATWSGRGDDLIAPPMMNFETPSSIRQAVYRERISREEGDSAFEAFLNAPIAIQHPAPLVKEAWDIGKTLNSTRLYDMYYVALAAIEGCELWTVDERLYNLASHRYPFVRWIGNSLP